MTARSRKLKRESMVRRERDPIPWKYCFLTLLCGLFLVGGFFWAARQHFASMDYGMKNAKLRSQIDELESEKRRLTLSREISLSPNEIKKAARKLGLEAMTAENIEIVAAETNKNAESVKVAYTNEPTAKKLVKKIIISEKRERKTSEMNRKKADKKKKTEYLLNDIIAGN